VGVFYDLNEPTILFERWRRHYGEVRPHNTLGYWPPAPAAIVLAPGRAGLCYAAAAPAAAWQ
jgi:hypothetical protein